MREDEGQHQNREAESLNQAERKMMTINYLHERICATVTFCVVVARKGGWGAYFNLPNGVSGVGSTTITLH